MHLIINGVTTVDAITVTLHNYMLLVNLTFYWLKAEIYAEQKPTSYIAEHK